MDVSSVIRRRLKELGLDQRDLAQAAGVTESYVSQLLTGKKAPPSPRRTAVYERMEVFLKLPAGDLSKLAGLQRIEVLKRSLGDPPAPLFGEVRGLILRKSLRAKEQHLRAIFEKETFGELERLVTQKLLDVVKRVVSHELEDEDWIRTVAQLNDRSYEEMRAVILEFLVTDIFNLSVENYVSFLEPLIESWDIDLETFAIEIVLNRRMVPEYVRKLEFVEIEREHGPFVGEEPGLEEFLRDIRLSGNVTKEEIEFLKRLKFAERRPTSLYYYRELQNLRDPLHFNPR